MSAPAGPGAARAVHQCAFSGAALCQQLACRQHGPHGVVCCQSPDLIPTVKSERCLTNSFTKSRP